MGMYKLYSLEDRWPEGSGDWRGNEKKWRVRLGGLYVQTGQGYPGQSERIDHGVYHQGRLGGEGGPGPDAFCVINQHAPQGRGLPIGS